MSTPDLPYGGTTQPRNSGWSGTTASRERAEQADADGTTSARQQRTLYLLRQGNGGDALWGGLTWRELSHLTGWHHGQASGVLSNLHKVGRITRLTERRNRCAVYVLPDHVNGRDTEPYGRPRQPVDALAVAAVQAEATIERIRVLHYEWTPGSDLPGTYCRECWQPFPCPTIRTITGEQVPS